ncbi:transcriptional regulator [Actinocatenispora thailandica]|uniref:Transcriptional regulator n=1 Tax=Actinocatenispora thailandica TaxID=227318 RepID=A0A7R7DVQ4_9ACTN|nr:LCP family protein [Actinocatenispora thailandica]BCJ38745.1 transcriptional regulator [Actinocatenispora thailandica]
MARARTGRDGRRKSPLWARLLVWVGAVLLVLSGGTMAAGAALLHRYDSSVHRADLIDGSSGHEVIDGAFDYLLLGSDKRPTDTTGDLGRSDTIMIAHVTADHRHAYLISIPRDLWVPIDDCGQGAGCTAKINAAYVFGGPKLTARTVEQLTGVSLDGMVIVSFQGFDRVVDALGGIRLCVDERSRSIHTGRLFTVGCHHFTGAEALDYVRQREDLPDGDYGRQRHQQQLIKAAAGEAERQGLSSNPAKLDRVIRAVGDDLTVDTNGTPLPDLVFSLHNISGSDITMLRLPEIDGYSPDGQAIQQLDDTGRSLFTAIREDDLATWAAAHPTLVNKNAG